MLTSRMTEEQALPRWARVCDVIVCVLAVLWPIVAIWGGIQIRFRGVRFLSITSAWRVAYCVIALVAVRHWFVRAPPLHTRIRRAVPEFLSTQRVFIGRAFCVASALLFLGACAEFYNAQDGLTELIDFGDRFGARALPALRDVPHRTHVDSWGYDGQFYAQLALDPLLRDPAMRLALDTPAFRARRILFSWTAYIAGAGRPAWILQAYAAQNIVCWLLIAWVLTRWFPPGRVRHFAGWFACLFSAGLMVSVRRALTDGPSMLLIALALLAVEQNRQWLAALLLGVSGLGRETNPIGGVMLVTPGRVTPAYVLRLAVFAVIVAVPLFLWMQYVHNVYQTYDTGIDAFGAPLSGYLQAWRRTIMELEDSGWWGPARHTVYALVSMAVETVYLVCRPKWRNPWWRVGLAYALLMAFVGTAVWSGYPTAATRASLPLAFAFNVLILEERWFWPLWVAGNLTVFSGLATIDLWSAANFL
jgi:hypothetical protein